MHPGVRSSRNSMKVVLTSRTDVSYLRDYKTGGEEGYAGRFLCLQGLFVFSATLPLVYSLMHSLCLSFSFKVTKHERLRVILLTFLLFVDPSPYTINLLIA